MRSTQAIASKNRALVPRVPSLMSAEPGSAAAKAPYPGHPKSSDFDWHPCGLLALTGASKTRR
jgi:hypothetical protein